MKNNFYKLLVTLIVFALTACQAATPTPSQGPAVDFFKDQPDRWLSVTAPSGWTANLGGTKSVPSVIVTNDWKGYRTTNTRAIGILITPLTDVGPAQGVLQLVVHRLGTMLTTPVGDVLLEEIAGQSYASVEYNGKSAEKENTPAHYFLTVIATGQRSVLVFSAVDVDQEKSTRPAYQTTVKAITLH
jgi:hypothetical protein